ncbi:DUF86 domain-containing protein [bacterium]|nr:DUF86 domain-containing protein [bacterium]MBU1753817.1 DUF86 domain-containing protein [bacterium]
MNDIVIDKVQSIHRSIERAREEYHLAGVNFRNDYSRQDAAILNITRACEMSIDLANYTIKTSKIGIPTSSAESFSLLARKQIIPVLLSEKMSSMVGFRNIAVHEYQKLQIEIIETIIRTGLDDLLAFSDCIVKEFSEKEA